MESKPGILLLVQVDHLNGENIGASIELFYEAGALNVNVVATVTKKNRPGYLVFIDCPFEGVDALETIVGKELEVGGWHRIETTHCYRRVQYLKKRIEIVYEGGNFDFIAEGKVIDDNFASLRPEARSCIELRDLLKDIGIRLSFQEIQNHIFRAFSSEESFQIKIKEGVNA